PDVERERSALVLARVADQVLASGTKANHDLYGEGTILGGHRTRNRRCLSSSSRRHRGVAFIPGPKRPPLDQCTSLRGRDARNPAQWVVTTIGSPRVMIIVCSNWADRLPLAPTSVQPSPASVTRRLFVDMNGSIVITIPSFSTRVSDGSK